MVFMPLIKDENKLIKTSSDLINLFKIFSDDSPGPFDYCICVCYNVLAFSYYALNKHEESVKCFEEIFNYSENFKIFAKTKEVKSDFIKYADKAAFLYNNPINYKQILLSAFDNMEKSEEPQYKELKIREDFQKFIEKLKT
jgi:hypothetical protein